MAEVTKPSGGGKHHCERKLDGILTKVVYEHYKVNNVLLTTWKMYQGVSTSSSSISASCAFPSAEESDSHPELLEASESESDEGGAGCGEEALGTLGCGTRATCAEGGAAVMSAAVATEIILLELPSVLADQWPSNSEA